MGARILIATTLIDTNVLIDYLAQHPDANFNHRVEQAIGKGSALSIITRIELLGWRRHTEQSRRDAENLLRSMGEIPLTHTVADRVIVLRSRFSIKLPDAIIAASALTENLPLMTRNTDDFMRIDGLVLVNPFAGA